jgi:peroxiredoxin Q/BCP
MTLRPGDPAPDFSVPQSDGSTLRLKDFRGRKVVLYFYPRDDTPGCTAEACSLRDGYAAIQAKNAGVLGVSTQSVDSHLRFSQKFGLDFPLLADTDRRIARAYGAIGAGPLGAIRGWLGLARRITYLIDEHGRISHVIDRPDCRNHAAQVLALL